MINYKQNKSQTKNYSTLFSTVSKTRLSSPECWPRKYGWNSSGRKQQGFTIIEVVLVLAIAGLIFLMVFIALPALQRNRRDTQRKNDLSRVKTALENYKSNNRGRLPSEEYYRGEFWRNYLEANGADEFKSPNGSGYIVNANFVMSDSGWVPSNPNLIHFALGMKCGENGSKIRDPRLGPNKYSLQIKLESGGVYCIDN